MGSKSKKRTTTTNTNQTAYDTRNNALSGDVENGAIGISGSKNNVRNFNYEDADFSKEIDGDIETGALAIQGANSGTITMTHGRAFDVVESVALAAIDGVTDNSKEALNETIEGLTHLNAGVAKNDEAIGAVKKIAYVAGGATAIAILAKAVKG